jgi:hypothetical protein
VAKGFLWFHVDNEAGASYWAEARNYEQLIMKLQIIRADETEDLAQFQLYQKSKIDDISSSKSPVFEIQAIEINAHVDIKSTRTYYDASELQQSLKYYLKRNPLVSCEVYTSNFDRRTTNYSC